MTVAGTKWSQVTPAGRNVTSTDVLLGVGAGPADVSFTPSQVFSGAGTLGLMLPVLTADTTYYVNASTGSDTTGSGTLAAPWQTPAFASNYINNKIIQAGFNVTLQLADGTYNLTAPIYARGNPHVGSTGFGIIIIGNQATPGNVIIQGAGAGATTCLYVDGVTVYIDGMRFINAFGDGISVNGNGILSSVGGNIEFGACATSQFRAVNRGFIEFDSCTFGVLGGAQYFMKGDNLGLINFNSNTVNLSNTPAYSSAFCGSLSGAVVNAFSDTFNGSATGARYSGLAKALIDTGTASATYFPGNAGGSVDASSTYL